jgi:hypothetical protein
MKNHKQQIIWQIYFPMLLIAGLFAFLTYSFFGKSLLGGLDLRIWSDISLIIILMPLFFSFIVTFIFLFFCIYLIYRYHSTVGALFSKLSNISIGVSSGAANFTNKLTQPIIQVEAFISQMLPQEKENDKDG